MNKETISIAPAKAAAVSEEEVTIYAMTALYKKRPLMITPVYDESISDYAFGLVNLTPEQRQKVNMLKEYTDSIAIRNMERFVLQKDKDGKYLLTQNFVKYNLALIQPNIAHSKKEANASMHSMYINNIELEAKHEVDKRRTIMTANSKLADLDEEGKCDLLYYFGYNPNKMSTVVREKNCYKIVDETPEQAIAYFTGVSSNRLVFVKRLLAADLIKKDSNGLITSTLGTLGFGEEAAAAFLYDEKNDKIFESLSEALKNKKLV